MEATFDEARRRTVRRLVAAVHTNKGDFGEDTASDALPGPAADRQVTIGAFTHEDPECDEHDEFDDPDGEPYNDTWRVSLRVSIATLGG